LEEIVEEMITKKQAAIDELRVIGLAKRDFGITIVLVLIGAVIQLVLGLIGIVISAPIMGGWIMWRMSSLNNYSKSLALKYGLGK
jgi:hypothetical protein